MNPRGISYSCYISFILVGRNDNYGGDFNERLQRSMDCLIRQLEKHPIDAEILLIDYNPIEGRPRLEETLCFREKPKHIEVKFITVPEEVHKTLIQPHIRKSYPVFEFIAKNIGIRRARGQFILCTNADIIFSANFIEFLSNKTLKSGYIYRCDRYDFKLKSFAGDKTRKGWEDAECVAKRGVFKFFIQGGTFHLAWPPSLKTRRWMLKIFNNFRKLYYYSLLHTPGKRYFLFFPKLRSEEIFLLKYHCNASGDMTLTDRTTWIRLKGYAENSWISTHTDSLFIMAAVADGLSIEFIPHPVFHQHHQRRFRFGEYNPDMDKMFERLLKEANAMLTVGKPIINKTDNWGLASLVLPERILYK